MLLAMLTSLDSETKKHLADRKEEHGIVTLDFTESLSDKDVLISSNIPSDSLSEEELHEMAHIFRTYMVAVRLGAVKDGKINCMALAGLQRDTMVHLGTIIMCVSPTGSPHGIPCESKISLP